MKSKETSKDDYLKQSSIQPPTGILSHSNYVYNKKRYVGGLYTWLFMWYISVPCFLTFCCFAIPTSHYILMHFITSLCHFISAGACLSWGLPSNNQSRSLSSQAAYMDNWLRYYLRWRITWPKYPLKHRVKRPLDGWQSQFFLSEDWARSRHSFIHSDIFIHVFIIGTYLSLFKCLIRLTTQRIHQFFDPRYTHWLYF